MSAQPTSKTTGVLRVDEHALGPRCFVGGVRVHEWHAGLVVVLAAVAAWLGHLGAPLISGLGLVGAWLVAKDWHDVVPSRRDTAAWRLGIHRAPARLRQAYRGESLPFAAGWLTGAVGVFNVLSAVTPGIPGRLAAVTALTGIDIPLVASSLALPAGLTLLVLAPYLVRRRQRALRAAVALLLALGALNLLKGLDVEEAIASWSLAALLAWGRDAFYVRHQAITLAEAARAVAAPAIAALTAGAAALAAEAWAAPSVAVGAGSVVALGVARVAFRPLQAPTAPDELERRTAIDLVRTNGTDTLSVFKLRRDLVHFISSDGQAFLSYRVDSGILLCSGDPVGPAAAIPTLLSEVCAFAEQRGLRIGFVGGSERLRELGRHAGLRALYIGDEAIVDTATFSLEGRAVRKVRQSVNRLRKAGYTAELRALRQVTPTELAQLEAVARRGLRGQPERGFSMAMDGLRGSHLDDSWVVIARDGSQTIRGLLHFVPTYGSSSASLSAMRRDDGVPNGMTEFMVVRAIEQLRDRGVQDVSLNFAAFARLIHEPRTRAERCLGRLLSIGERFFQIESLLTFNAKFFPRWEPRYLLFEGIQRLPRTALATLWAEGQVPRPSVPRLGYRR